MKNSSKLKLEKSNFRLLEKEFSDIITRVDETDQTGMNSRSTVTRRCILL